MKSDILVSVPGEENADDQAERRAAAVEEAAEAVMETLGDYAVSLWGDVLAAAGRGSKEGGGGLTPPRRTENSIKKTAPRLLWKNKREAVSADENTSRINLT